MVNLSRSAGSAESLPSPGPARRPDSGLAARLDQLLEVDSEQGWDSISNQTALQQSGQFSIPCLPHWWVVEWVQDTVRTQSTVVTSPVRPGIDNLAFNQADEEMGPGF